MKGALVDTVINSKIYVALVAKDISIASGSETLTYVPLCKWSDVASWKMYLEKCPSLSFEGWWHKEIFDNGRGVKFSRKDLVTHIANLDGYAHIEENLNSNYEIFKHANILDGFQNSNSKVKVNLVTLNMVRQIAFEVLYSLCKNNIHTDQNVNP